MTLAARLKRQRGLAVLACTGLAFAMVLLLGAAAGAAVFVALIVAHAARVLLE